MALAPEWMSYPKEPSSLTGPRMLGKERERTKYGKQHSYNNLSSYLPSSAQNSFSHDPDRITTPFACSLSSPPAPRYVPSILGDNPRVLNRSKSSPGFGSPKPKPKKSPDRNFSPSKPLKPKPPKPAFNPASYGKSVSQPDLFTSERTSNWHHQKLQSSASFSSSSVPASPSPLATSSTVSSPPPPHVPPSTSPPLPPSSSPPPSLVPEIDKLKQLIPSTGMPPKSVRPRGVVGPPLPKAKKAPSTPPPSANLPNSTSPVPSERYFRKATSEPSLIHHKAPVRSNSKKARAMETEKAQIQLLKEASGAKQPNRSNFFQHIINREVSGAPILEDESPIGNDQVSSVSADARPITPTTSPPPPPSISPPPGLRSPLPEDMEDEERFLRTLGWVPDEEDPVPVLAEEEMAEVKIFLSKAKHPVHNDGVPEGIDVGGK